MKKTALALATMFTLAACGDKNASTEKPVDTVDTIDYQVTAYTPKGDTAWSVVADGEYDFYTGRAGAKAVDKKSGVKYEATPGTTVVVKPFNPSK